MRSAKCVMVEGRTIHIAPQTFYRVIILLLSVANIIIYIATAKVKWVTKR